MLSSGTGPADVMPTTTNTTRRRLIPLALTRTLRSSEHRALLAAGDLAAALFAGLIAVWLWSIPAGAQFSREFVGARLPWFAGAAVMWLAAAGLPSVHRSVALSVRRTVIVLLRGTLALILLYLSVYFYVPRGVLPRLAALYFLWEALLLTLAWRLIFVAVFTSERFRGHAIVVGSGAAAALAVDLVRRHRARWADVVAVVVEGGGVHADLAGTPAVRPEGLPDLLAERRVSEIILAVRHRPSGALLQTLLECQEAGIELVRVQTLIEQTVHRVPVDLLEADWLMTDLADAMRVREASWLGKRALDLMGSFVGLALAALIAPVVVLAIWLDSGRPIFYRQQRLGRAGVPIILVKFRTMRRDAEQPGEARWADPADPRVTRVGRVLRKLRLDELPQFWNVFRGDMSLVGPRPEREEFVAELEQEIPFYRARLMVPPGLTGWAQVNLPYADSVAAARSKLEYDLYYVKHRSALFDLRILLRTLGTVFAARGV